MSEIVNFNKARKAAGKARDKAHAAENRIRHGRTRAEKTLDAARADLAARRLEQTRRDPD